ncbi:hypothetical protein [Amycolatopsis sp. MEPSY49]|uniref:hypothetical protein n=1 Tax=Amycolatopsis sp. MEPSY49 TaxID=3151600 RepID=UPI003EF18675
MAWLLHRRQYPAAGAEDFALGLGGQQRHQCPVIAVAQIDRTGCLGEPELNTVAVAPAVEGGEPGAGEGAFVFTDHDRIDRGLPAGGLGHELGSLRSLVGSRWTDVAAVGS